MTYQNNSYCTAFIIKSKSIRHLELSRKIAKWAVLKDQRNSLNHAFDYHQIVYLIFNVLGTQCFQGYAKMNSKIDFNDIGYQTPAFNIKWIVKYPQSTFFLLTNFFYLSFIFK